MSAETIGAIVKYWFGTLKPKDWYRRDEMIDNKITARFGHTYEQFKSSVPGSWLGSPEGFLAAILVLDQFPRNMFRDDPRAFVTDPAALALAKQAISEGQDMKLPPARRAHLHAVPAFRRRGRQALDELFTARNPLNRLRAAHRRSSSASAASRATKARPEVHGRERLLQEPISFPGGSIIKRCRPPRG
jgi:hypothetical protein